jgi:hypothetical protein
MKHIEDVVGLATHLTLGISRCSPLFKPTGKVGEEHIVCAPTKATVNETLEAFLKQQSNFAKATFIVNDTAAMKRLVNHKMWKQLDISEIYKNTTKPLCVFTWKKQETSEVGEVCKFVLFTFHEVQGSSKWRSNVCIDGYMCF